jgi:apolipoprotein N-acyltransferase
LSTRSLDFALAAASGVLLAVSFPRFGHPAVAWIALAPLLVALAGEPRVADSRSHPLRRAFALGLVTGGVYFTGTLYWITRVMALYGGISGWVAVLINLALIAYLALFPAVFAIIVRRIVIAHGASALMAAPLVWVATELGRTYLLTGFPWVLLGYSQVGVLPVAQSASVFGVYGLSMLVAAMSAALAIVAVKHPADAGYSRYLPAAGVLALVAGIAVWGSRRAASATLTRSGDPIRVGLIQGNVDQGEKWDPARAAGILRDYLRLTEDAVDKGARVVVWPESSTSFYFEEDRANANQIRALARQRGVSLLFGSDQVDWRIQDNRRVPDKYYNSAFLVRPDGSTGGSYRKMHLVPFGEYVPLKELLFFAGPLVEAVGPFSAGVDPSLLPVDGHPVSVAICYEVVYPNLIRQFVAGGSQLLTTITNDAWFGRTAAPYQHFAQASMRAIEEGRYLVRSANTGISGIVDPYGRVLAKTDIFEQTVLVGEARFLTASTFYARHGDVLAYASCVVTLALLAMSRRRVQ